MTAFLRHTVTFTCLALSGAVASPTVHAQTAGCVQAKDGYRCNWSAMKAALDQAHTAAPDISPRDRTALRQVEQLIRDLGKTPVETPAAVPADLTLLLSPVEPTGVNLGPTDHDLATLRIYAREAGDARGQLLWVETLRGAGDRAWPAQVHALIAQFQARLRR